MANIYLTNPKMLDVDTSIIDLRPAGDGVVEVTLGANPLRPAGGGQPRDSGRLVADGRSMAVLGIHKMDGQTRITLPAGNLAVGDQVQVEVDAARRHRLSQCHTLTHVGMSAARAIIPGYESRGADIAENGDDIELRIMASGDVTPDMVRAIDKLTRSRIGQDVPVRIERAKSIEAAAQRYPAWRIDPGLSLSGKIRVVLIGDFDANPCSGSHVASTAEIGPFEMVGHRDCGGGLHTLHMRKLDAWTYWF
jgi:Ser-tRNA(Ala) deacylase AlaX